MINKEYLTHAMLTAICDKLKITEEEVARHYKVVKKSYEKLQELGE